MAVAAALSVAPTGATTVGELDGALHAVHLALVSASMNDPRGQVVPIEALTARATEILTAQQDCHHDKVGAALPALIRDLHTTLAAGRDERAILRLLVLIHVQGTQAWLMDIGASIDLAWQAATL